MKKIQKHSPVTNSVIQHTQVNYKEHSAVEEKATTTNPYFYQSESGTPLLPVQSPIQVPPSLRHSATRPSMPDAMPTYFYLKEQDVMSSGFFSPIWFDIQRRISFPSPKHYRQGNGQHQVLAEACVGLQHRNQAPYPLPCQDAVRAVTQPRPVLIACDGAGSAAGSDIGSTSLAIQLTRFCQSIEPILPLFLDVEQPAQEMQLLVRMLIRQAMGILQDLSLVHRRDVRDFRSTLNMAIVGQARILWIRVGDGEIIQERISYSLTKPEQIQSELHCMGEQAKGEFANQTLFIDQQLTLSEVQWGELISKETTGLALMSDGATEKLVAWQRNRISGQISDWLKLLRQSKLKASDIVKRFYAEDFNKHSTGDDRCIALWAQGITEEKLN